MKQVRHKLTLFAHGLVEHGLYTEYVHAEPWPDRHGQGGYALSHGYQAQDSDIKPRQVVQQHQHAPNGRHMHMGNITELMPGT
jgi:hypothetical protein